MGVTVRKRIQLFKVGPAAFFMNVSNHGVSFSFGSSYKKAKRAIEDKVEQKKLKG